MTKTQGAPGCRHLDLAFISSNLDWGGSEDLWSETAAVLARAGHKVRVFKNRLPRDQGNLAELATLSDAVELARFPLLPAAVYRPVQLVSRPLDIAWQAAMLGARLALRRRPDLAIVSQGGNHDGWPLASICRRLGIPYVLLSHKATDLYWPIDKWLPSVRRAYAAARHVFFVSEHCRRLTGEQLGEEVTRSSIVRNPFRVPWDWRGAWPGWRDGLRLACVSRLAPREKGQDLVLRVLALPKWRARTVSLTFFGEGEQRQGLERMAAQLGLGNVAFAGHVPDVTRIWEGHHGLVLPSRAEGLPLVIVEAMLCGRVPIVTDVGGNAELLRNGATGFVAKAATEADLDEALERAWRRRAEWPEIGAEASRSVRIAVPEEPGRVFAGMLERLCTDAAAEVPEPERREDEPGSALFQTRRSAR